MTPTPRPALSVTVLLLAGLACACSGGGGGATTLGPVTSHRPQAIVCSNGPGDAGVHPQPDAATGSKTVDPRAPSGGSVTCVQDNDCPPCANGQIVRCLPTLPAITEPWSCVCDQCSRDEDCGGTDVCRCRNPSDRFSFTGCIPSMCRTDADCGKGGSCSPSADFMCGDGVSGYFCHTQRDTCNADADCTAGTCRHSPQIGAWTCATGTCKP